MYLKCLTRLESTGGGNLFFQLVNARYERGAVIDHLQSCSIAPPAGDGIDR
jgi:hypothetical protein